MDLLGPLMSAVVGALLALTAVNHYSEKSLTACEEQHNIFRCEWGAQPAPPPSHT